jgi:hypothetical protein
MAIRVVIQVTGDQVELVGATHVDMPAPGEAGLIEPPEQGMYVELRGEGNEAVFRRSISARVDRGVEVFDANGTPRRADVPQRTETVMLVLPDDMGPRAVAFIRGAGRGAGGGRGVRSQAASEPNELAVFSLDGVADR